MPLVKPLLPDWFASPPNLAGTFSYSVERTLREIATTGSRDEPTFAAGHITYLHLDRYPASFELTRHEFMRVWRAPTARLRDTSLDWQSDDSDTDPIQLRQWKTQRLLHAVDETFTSTGFLKRGGKLVLFSDHGHRAGLSLDNFGEDRFHHVILTTFGLPHGPLLQPVSLTEIGRIAGLITNHASVSPTVEFTVTSAEHWDEMKSTANLRWNGDVVLEQGLVNRVFGTLRRYQPWGKDGTRPGTTSMD